MKTVNSLEVATGTPKPFAAGPAAFFPVASARAQRRDVLSLREAVPLWFAMLSPLIGLIIGFLGAWLLSSLTS